MLTPHEIDEIGDKVAAVTGPGRTLAQRAEDCRQQCHLVYLERADRLRRMEPGDQQKYLFATVRRQVLQAESSAVTTGDDEALAEIEARRESAAEEIERLIQDAPDEIWEYLWNRVRLGLSRDETCRAMRTHNERLNQIREDAAEWLLCQYEGVPYEPRVVPALKACA